MRGLIRPVVIAAVYLGGSGAPAYAAIYSVRGDYFLVSRTPGPGPSRRTVRVVGKERRSNDLGSGDPIAHGASVEIVADGATPTRQRFILPPGTSRAGSPGWRRLRGPLLGYAYDDRVAVNGPVTTAVVKRRADGTVVVAARIEEGGESIALVPPAPGTDGGMRFVIDDDTYCVAFGGPAGGAVINWPPGSGADLFAVLNTATAPTTESGCPSPPSTTTTSTSSTATSTTSTSTTFCGQLVAKWGSTGTGNGQLQYPTGIAIDHQGNVLVVDGFFNRRIQKFTKDGTFLATWGAPGSGPGVPWGIAVDPVDDVLVSLFMYTPGIQRFTNAGTLVAFWDRYDGGFGEFGFPRAIAADGEGNLFVFDTDPFYGFVKKFDGTGALLMSWGTFGSGPGQFKAPGGIAVDRAGNVFVTDVAEQRVQKFTNGGSFLGAWKSPYLFGDLYGITVDGAGNVFVADGGSNRILKFTNHGVFVTQWYTYGGRIGQNGNLYGIAADGDGNVFVADFQADAIQKFACPP